MAGNVKLMTSAGGGVVLDTATTTATDVTVKVPVTGVNNGTLVCSDSSGNVGIGTSSPSQKLQVVGAIAATGQASALTPSSSFSDYIVGSNKARFAVVGDATGTAGQIVLSQYSSNGSVGRDAVTIDSSGNLLVGGTSVNESFALPTIQGSTNCLFTNKRNTTGSASQFRFYNPNGMVGEISTSGSSTSYGTSSDYRLKENIQPMQNALGVVAQLNPVTYTWKSDGSDGQGFIAHELQAVVPACVTGEKDAVDEQGKPVYQGIDTSFLVATLTKAIQEQQAQIETLTAKVAALEAK